MAEKSYYWLKLPKDFFKRHDIKYIMTLPEGDHIVLFYLQLMVESIDHDGELRFSPNIPYSEAMLASVTDTDVEIVKNSLVVLKELELVKVSEDGTIILEKVKNMVGFETEWARKKKEYRERLRQSQDNEETNRGQCPPNVLPMSDKSKSKSKSKSYIERTIQERPLSHFTPPTVEEVRTYCIERGNQVDPERFVDFYECKNWFVGKNKMRDWKAAVRTWEKRDTDGTRAIVRPQLPSGGNEFTALLTQEGYQQEGFV